MMMFFSTFYALFFRAADAVDCGRMPGYGALEGIIVLERDDA